MIKTTNHYEYLVMNTAESNNRWMGMKGMNKNLKKIGISTRTISQNIVLKEWVSIKSIEGWNVVLIKRYCAFASYLHSAPASPEYCGTPPSCTVAPLSHTATGSPQWAREQSDPQPWVCKAHQIIGFTLLSWITPNWLFLRDAMPPQNPLTVNSRYHYSRNG